MASGSKNLNNKPKFNAVVEEKSNKKNKKKKSIISILSNKLQKKITRTLVKSFVEINPTTASSSTKLLKDHSENGDHHDTNQKESPVKESPRARRLREISERRKREEESNNKENKEPILLPVPPRYSSNIPVRGSSSNYDVNYFNSNLFDQYSLSQSLPQKTSQSKSNLHKELSIKRSNSDLTPSSSTENLANLNPDNKGKISGTSAITLVQDSKISLTFTDEVLKESLLPPSESGSSSPSSSSVSNSNSNSESSDSEISSSCSSDSEKDKPLNENSEKFYFDEKRGRSIRKPIHSEKSRKINDLFRRDSEKYMDQQLIDLCSTYYKDYYYGKSSGESSSSFDSESEGVIGKDKEPVEDNKSKSQSVVAGTFKGKYKSSKKSKSDDEKTNDDEGEVKDRSFIVKSNSSLSYFTPIKTNSTSSTSFIPPTKNSGCTITKSNTLPVMDSKRISPKIITCPSNDPEKPTTHLVNISGVTIQTNDLSHLFWVPSYLHPEVHPLEFKKLMLTEANSQGNMFGRRVSIKRTKSFAESARVITPENISEDGEPVIDQIKRHKTFDSNQSYNKNQEISDSNKGRKVSLRKSFTIEEEEEGGGEGEGEKEKEKTTTSITTTTPITTTTTTTPVTTEKEKIDNDSEKIRVKKEGTKTNKVDSKDSHDDQLQTPIPDEKNEAKLEIDTTFQPLPEICVSDVNNSSSINISPTKPINPSTLQNSSSIPDSTSEESSSKPEIENIIEKSEADLSSKIFLPNAADGVENIPLVHGSLKVEDNSPAKSGWSLWLASFGKDDKKDVETSKKHKRNSAASPRLSFSFFKSKSSTSLADKNINYRQGKGITKAFLLDYPLIFKPLSREAEDTIYSLSHTKLATTYRPMVQQVYINNIMQRYIRKYKDAAYKIPFKQIRPPKKRRTLPKQLQQQQPLSLNNFHTPMPPQTTPKKNKKSMTTPVSLISSNFNLDEPFKARTDSRKKNRGKKVIQQKKLVDLGETKLDNLLERGIESNGMNAKKPKRRSKVRPLSDTISEKDAKTLYKNLNHSISMEQLEKYNSPKMDKKHKRYSSSAAILNGYNYANYASSSSSSSNSSDDDDDDDDDDDEIPLAMLKNKRSSIITI